MGVEELKYVLDQLYGFDIARKTKTREVVYAKRVFVNLAFKYGHKVKHICKEVNLNHSGMKHHRDNFGSINPIDLNHYNKCVEYFRLPMETIPSINSINGDYRLLEALDDISALNTKDLKYFREKVLKPFLSKLKFEKSVIQLDTCK